MSFCNLNDYKGIQKGRFKGSLEQSNELKLLISMSG